MSSSRALQILEQYLRILLMVAAGYGFLSMAGGFIARLLIPSYGNQMISNTLWFSMTGGVSVWSLLLFVALWGRWYGATAACFLGVAGLLLFAFLSYPHGDLFVRSFMLLCVLGLAGLQILFRRRFRFGLELDKDSRNISCPNS